MTPEATWYGTDSHPEVTEISDLTEGLLEVSHAHQVRAHLAGCSLCTEVQQSLQEIRGALGTLPGPPRVPDDVAGRIDAALAAEALLATERPSPVSRETEPADPTVVSRETAGSKPRPRRTAGPTSGSRRPGGPSRRPGGAGPGRQTARTGRRLHTLLATAGALGALVLGGALFQGLGGDPAPPSADQSTAQERSGSDGGAVAGDGGLEQRVQALLDKPVKSPPGASSETGQPEDTAPLVGGPTTVPSCVRAGIGRPEQPLAAEAGTPYAGRPSYLVVLPHPGDPQRVDAYVVDASCATEDTAGAGELLTQRTYARD